MHLSLQSRLTKTEGSSGKRSIHEETDFFLDFRGQRARPTISFIYHCNHATRGPWCPSTEQDFPVILKAPCNSHLSTWSLLLPLFCPWSYLLKQSIPFVSFCVFVLVFTESSDKYHPYTSVRVLVSVVSSTTHTSLCDLFVLSIACQKSLPNTCFQLDFHCCLLSHFIAVHAQELPTTEHTGPFQPCHPDRFALPLYIASSPSPKLCSHLFFLGGGVI